MEKKIYSRPVSDCMIIALNEVLMTSPGGGAGAPPYVVPIPSGGDFKP